MIATSDEAPPNILFIITDQQRFDALGANGNPAIRTPHLDRLAAEGVNFGNVFVQSPFCTPSRAALATGRYPSVNGARWNGIGLPAHERTFMQGLAEHGYETDLFGKLHLLPHITRTTDDPLFGFDRAEINEHPRPHWASAYTAWLEVNHPDAVNPEPVRIYSKELEVWVGGRPIEAHLNTWVGDRTVDYLRSQPVEPFFATASFYDPHHPFDPPEPYASMYDPAEVPLPAFRHGELDDKPAHFLDTHLGRVNPIFGHVEPPATGGPTAPMPDLSQVPESLWRQLVAHYYGMVSMIDDQVGRIMATLEESGLAENTIVIFTSDHGELLGDHGLLFKGPHHYDCLLQVPLIAWAPGRFPAGRTVDGLVELIDLAPTFLELAGAAIPTGMQGRSLVPLLTGETDQARDSVLIERQDYYWQLDARTVRTADWKLTAYGGKPFGELFDLVNDPGEIVNRWDDPAYLPRRLEMMTLLVDRMIAAGDTLPAPTALV